MALTLTVAKREGQHTVEITDSGELVLLDHLGLDLEIELAAAELGFRPPPCVQLYSRWLENPLVVLLEEVTPAVLIGEPLAPLDTYWLTEVASEVNRVWCYIMHGWIDAFTQDMQSLLTEPNLHYLYHHGLEMLEELGTQGPPVGGGPAPGARRSEWLFDQAGELDRLDSELILPAERLPVGGYLFAALRSALFWGNLFGGWNTARYVFKTAQSCRLGAAAFAAAQVANSPDWFDRRQLERSEAAEEAAWQLHEAIRVLEGIQAQGVNR